MIKACPKIKLTLWSNLFFWFWEYIHPTALGFFPLIKKKKEFLSNKTLFSKDILRWPQISRFFFFNPRTTF